MTPAPAVEARPTSRVPFFAALVAFLAIPVNCVLWFITFMGTTYDQTPGLVLFTCVAIVQLIAGLVAVVSGIRHKRAQPAIVGAFASVGALAGWGLGVVGFAVGSMGGGSWGRPLRVRGRQLHPNLREGADWTRGDRPDASGLDGATCRALEALWLHDAQKEHASVPAFARVSWVLAAVGAPAELLEWSHRAALEELEHTRLCFALAAGYGGRSHTVEAMPDLLVGGLTVEGDPLATLATESLTDGCQLEDFNADVAAECATVCREPVTRAVLKRIAVEERSHAEFSWAVLAWVLERDRRRVAPAVEAALKQLATYPRPTAVSAEKRALVSAADPAQLRAKGRLPDERWAQLWDVRLAATRERAEALLSGRPVVAELYRSSQGVPSGMRS